jgi:hypothetical protein
MKNYVYMEMLSSKRLVDLVNSTSCATNPSASQVVANNNPNSNNIAFNNGNNIEDFNDSMDSKNNSNNMEKEFITTGNYKNISYLFKIILSSF